MRRLAVGLFMLLLAACGRASPPADTLRVGVPVLPSSWGDPFRADSGPPILTLSAMFEGLTRLDEHGRIAPALAESWSTTDGRTWRFTLRPGARFSDGSTLDAQAVAATFRWLATAEGRASMVGGRMRNVASVEAPDPRTVVLTLKKPDAIFYKQVSVVMIVGPDAWRRLGPAAFAKSPVGAGPYRLVRFDERRRQAVLEANPYARRQATIRKLRIIELTDEAVRQQALISGDIDIARVGLDGAHLLEARGIKVMTSPAMNVMALAFVVEGRVKPLKDVRVRQALNYAVDKEAISRTLLRGEAAPSGQPGARGTVGHNPALVPYPHDPVRARRMLAEAGYPNGFPLKIEVMVGNMPSDGLIYQAIAGDFEKVGIRTEVRAVPYAVWMRKNASLDWGDTGGINGSFLATPHNDIQRPLEAYSCLRPNPQFCDRALTAKIRAAQSELSEDKRLAMLHEISAGYREAAPGVFLVEQVDVYGVSPRVRGLVIAGRNPAYDRASLDRTPLPTGGTEPKGS